MNLLISISVMTLILLCLPPKGFSLICYDAIKIDKTDGGSVPSYSHSGYDNNCKVCITLTVTQTLQPGEDPYDYPTKLVRRYCETNRTFTCSRNDGFTCLPADNSTFRASLFISKNSTREQWPVLINEDNAMTTCRCCDTNLCNSDENAEPVPSRFPCEETGPDTSTNEPCFGCITFQTTNWAGVTNETARCHPTPCESYDKDCPKCNSDNFKDCKCTCAINYPKSNVMTFSSTYKNAIQTFPSGSSTNAANFQHERKLKCLMTAVLLTSLCNGCMKS